MNAALDPGAHRLVLVDPDDASRELLRGRLQAQGYPVFATASPAEAATAALADPPAAIVARLWMPSISGVQLCHLLKSEAATAHVPVVLLGEGFAPRGRFWAEQAGARYVQAGAVGELLRTIARAIHATPPCDEFFTMLGDVDLRDRIGRLLDRRLFDSMLASEVRALAGSESFVRLFDQLSQLMCRLAPYGWLALSTEGGQLGLHCRPERWQEALDRAREVLALPQAEPLLVLDEDAWPRSDGERVSTATICFCGQVLGRLAVGAEDQRHELPAIIELVAQELGSPLRVALLVEDTRRLAQLDPLTSAMNRRAFLASMDGPEACARAQFVGLIDVDHFKLINDGHGHAVGDQVLQRLGAFLVARLQGRGGVTCRWGGEEFVIAYPWLRDGAALAEELRKEIAGWELPLPDGAVLRMAISMGLTVRAPGEDLDAVILRADGAMYQAKQSGRNRVCQA